MRGWTDAVPTKASAEALETLLCQLGFQQIASVSGSHKAFEHKQTNTIVVLGWAPPERKLNPAIVAGVRRLLDEKGVIDSDAFDRDLQRLVDHQSTRSERGIFP
jgi:predicted RNA binding protein YcfA (HicA-like mRNA interferase family)